MQIGSAHDPFLRAVNYVDRSSILGRKKKKWRNRVELSDSRRRRRRRWQRSYPILFNNGTLFSLPVIGARLKQVKIIFRSGLIVFNYRFRKKKERKRKTQVGRGEGFYVVATSRARNNPLKYFSTSRVRRCFRVIHVFLSFFLSFFIINELLYLFVTYMFRGNRFLFFSSNFKFQRFFSSFYQKNLG